MPITVRIKELKVGDHFEMAGMEYLIKQEIDGKFQLGRQGMYGVTSCSIARNSNRLVYKIEKAEA